MVTIYKEHRLEVFRVSDEVYYSVIRLSDGEELDCGHQGGLIRECIYSLKEEIDERERQ